ncbi:Clr5 domain-containing protein [Daldinia caldariorum]|uniref:Clr5 domain-containing protein n=1 Tax=Daldinia caldariorum TaxID=326644 RepID=UPI002007B7EE|nr:Clr5 domain-containing protein [Daldinia caldariorum]KAI1464530.1 Clr5 domain-containing protein [Daldinia caldariorum]
MDTPDSHHTTTQDWARLRDVITRLYLDEDKTLDEVKSYMEEHHGFYSTVSMYKKKLAAWGAFKNLRFDEVLQILYLKKHRDRTQKPSTFYIRSREVDNDNLQVYLSRNPSVFAKLDAGATPNPEAIRDVTCRTPPLGSSAPASKRLSPSPMRSIPVERRRSPVPSFPEDMFQALHVYLDQSFETGLWSWSDSYCWNTHGRSGPSGLLSALLDRCITISLSVSRQAQPGTVRKALDTPFSMLDLSMATYGQKSPLTRFWKSFVSIPYVEQRNATERVLALCVSEYSTRLGPTHPLTIETYLKYFDAVEREKDPRVQLQSLQYHLSKIRGNFADRPLLGLLKLEHALATCKLNLDQGYLDKAEEALSRLGPNSLVARDESFRCLWLGYIKCIRGDFQGAEFLYKHSVFAARLTGSRECILESLFQLETFLLHTKQPFDAEKIRAERFRMFRKLDSLVWADQSEPHLTNLTNNTTSPMISIIHIGSTKSNTKWRPSAFNEVTEYVRASNSPPS